MSSTVGRVFFGLARASFIQRVLFHDSTRSKLNSARSIALTTHRTASSKKSTDDEPNNEPIKFSESKASHRTWKVKRSMGSQHQLPWWKVLPISLLATGFMLWCALRSETDIDVQLEKHLPIDSYSSDEQEEEERDDKSS